MAEFPEDFNPADVPENDHNFEPLPAGDYSMQVIDSAITDTKSGSGQQLVLTLEVIDGQYSNRRVWDRLNIRNQNAEAQRIAQRSLADLCLAIGHEGTLRDSVELHFKPFVGRLMIKTDKSGQYSPQNTVRYKPRGGTASKPVARAPTVASADGKPTGTVQAPVQASQEVRPTAPTASHSNPRPWAAQKARTTT